jgi:acyl-CoA thioesterase-1
MNAADAARRKPRTRTDTRRPPFSLLACLACAALFLNSCRTPSDRPIREADYTHPIRVACVGNSITFGYGIKDREQDSYPAQLQGLLGNRWQVMNFGFNGATLLKHGTKPYSHLPVYREVLSFKPDVVIIELGTNDTNQKSWPPHREEFVLDYVNLVRSFQELETRPRVYLCLPVPLFRDRGKEYDTDRILTGEVIPKIRDVGRKTHVLVIDLYAQFADKAVMFPDGVHPDARGARVMAAAVYAQLVDPIRPQGMNQ